jgi:D-beta-D-heptose 7-phosphate kinase / D-beta-D-heptose 1-phosphate adenosyltransferase
MSERLIVVGDALLDRDIEGSVDRLCPDAPVPVVDEPRSHTRPGGAALAAVLAARSGHPVTLLAAIARDPAGEELLGLLQEAGVDVIALESHGPTVEKIRIRSEGRTLLRLDHGARQPAAISTAGADLSVLTDATVLVSDYGRGVTALAEVRDALSSPDAVVIWDPHPRGTDPVRGCELVTPNRAEAGLPPDASIANISARARDLSRTWDAASVAVTLGSRGALLVSPLGIPLAVPAPHVALGDPCGAGDCFAATAAGLIAGGRTAGEAVTAAVGAASAFVAAGGAAAAGIQDAIVAPHGVNGLDAARRVIASTRSRGGRVVATGGCFDLLHAGHVASLRAARSLGECLVVCVNSDESVRRRKGPSRPLVAERDRVEVLAALACVDAVVVFDEDTPEAVLTELRPDVFVKGGDYEVAAMPEAQAVRSWGGEVAIVPYLEGYSTSGLLEEAQRRAG